MLERPIVWVVKAYQILVRPWLGAHCRFEPTCSEYMIEALETHGAVRGTWLGLRRIGRCHPWGKSGYDPVPGASTDSPHIHDRHG